MIWKQWRAQIRSFHHQIEPANLKKYMMARHSLRKTSVVILSMLLAACATHRRTDTQQHPGTEPAPTTSHDKPRDVAYQGTPWVVNLSSPHRPAKGLYNRHIALWSSHGRYYNQEKDKWLWQRPNLFCTNEDLFTQIGRASCRERV